MDAARIQKTNRKSKQAVGAECKNDALTATVHEVARQCGTASKQTMERFGTGITICPGYSLYKGTTLRMGHHAWL